MHQVGFYYTDPSLQFALLRPAMTAKFRTEEEEEEEEEERRRRKKIEIQRRET